MRSSLFLVLLAVFTCIFYSCEQELDVTEYDQMASYKTTAVDPLIIADAHVGGCCDLPARLIKPVLAPFPALKTKRVTFTLNSTTHSFYSANGGLKYVFYRKNSNGDYIYNRTLHSVESSPSFCLGKGDYRCIIISNACEFDSIDWETGCGYTYIGGKSCSIGNEFSASDALCFSISNCN